MTPLTLCKQLYVLFYLSFMILGLSWKIFSSVPVIRIFFNESLLGGGGGEGSYLHGLNFKYGSFAL